MVKGLAVSIFEEYKKGYNDPDHRLRKIFGSRHMQDATAAQTLRRLSVQDPRAHGCINAGEAFALPFLRLCFRLLGLQVWWREGVRGRLVNSKKKM